MEVEESRFKSGIRKKVFSVRVVRQWNEVPEENVGAPSLEVFIAKLDGALRNVV